MGCAPTPMKIAQASLRLLLQSLLGAAGLSFAVTAVPAQAPVTASICPMEDQLQFHRCALEAARNFKPQSRGVGKPDMSGLWRRRTTTHEDIQAHPQTDDDHGGPSSIVDPADGVIPYQPWVLARLPDNVKRYMHHNAACLLSGVPVSMYQGTSRTYQFIQTLQRLVVLSPVAHAWRLVPLDGTPFLSPAMHLWRGDSRGKWDGNTLVIETRNQTGIPWLDQRGRFVTSDVRVDERLTMIDANTIHYAVTLYDANVLTRPFTMAMAFRRDSQPDSEIQEDACYEGNQTGMEQQMSMGLRVFPGVSPDEAKAAAREFSLRH